MSKNVFVLINVMGIQANECRREESESATATAGGTI